MLEEVKFLNHVISNDRVGMDTSKIEAVVDWQCPAIVHEVKTFMGLVGYYRRLIEGFSRLSSPLTVLTRKKAMFVWTEKCE